MENFFFFTSHINEQISNNILKFKNISVVYNDTSINNLKDFLIIKKLFENNEKNNQRTKEIFDELDKITNE